MEVNNHITIFPAFYDDRYFIFRENGQEIEFTIKNNKIKSSTPLTREERVFIYKNIKEVIK